MKNSFLKIMAMVLVLLFSGTSVVSAGAVSTAKSRAVNSCSMGQWHYKALKSNKNKEKDKEKGPKNKGQSGKKSKEVNVTTVTINKTSLSLSQGSWVRLTATVKPDNAHNKKVVWATKDSTVATVNPSGKVTGIRPGRTEITAIALNGNIKATCIVTVTEKATTPVEDDDTDTDTDVDSIKIDTTTDYIAIKEGTTKSLSVTIEPENTDESLIWSSSNTSVAVVDRHGNVTAVDEGRTTITVKTSDGSESDSCTIRVIDESDWVSVRRVEINLVNTTIPAGFDENLKYRLEPSSVSDQEVKWSSSNEDIASVDIWGTVHGKRQGTVEITATSADGRRSDSCLVTVTAGIQPPSSGILLNKISSTLEVGAKDFPTATVYPSGSSPSITWSSSDTSKATVNSSGEVTAIDDGPVIITAITANNQRASYLLIVEP